MVLVLLEHWEMVKIVLRKRSKYCRRFIEHIYCRNLSKGVLNLAIFLRVGT